MELHPPNERIKSTDEPKDHADGLRLGQHHYGCWVGENSRSDLETYQRLIFNDTGRAVHHFVQDERDDIQYSEIIRWYKCRILWPEAMWPCG